MPFRSCCLSTAQPFGKIDSCAELRVNADVRQRLSIPPILDALPSALDNRPSQLRRADQGRTAAFGRNFFCRATHVDIQSIETKFTHDVCDLIKHLRCMPIDLRNHGTFDLGIHKVSEQSVWSME